MIQAYFSGKITYSEVQQFVKKKYCFTPRTCWIADAKRACEYKVKKAHNRKGKKMANPCPYGKIEAVKYGVLHVWPKR
ncbi:MAG: hypothetical protein AABW85_06045 [archaeon]